MTRSYASPDALEQSLKARIAQRYPKTEFQLRRNEIAYRRLVARMFDLEPDRWVLKGGYALILRLDPNRTSNDVDVGYVADAGEHAVALAALHRAAAHDLDDFFSFEIVRFGAETEDQARRVSVVCRLGAREFARFRVDLAVPRADIPAESIEAPPLSGLPEIDSVPPLRVLAWPQQIAEKVCAIFEQHEGSFSSRARDLGDLAMIAEQIDGLDGSELADALVAEAARRRLRTLPDGLPARFDLADAQERAWRASFPKAIRGAPIAFDEALDVVARFVGPLLDTSVRNRIWNAHAQRYE